MEKLHCKSGHIKSETKIFVQNGKKNPICMKFVKCDKLTIKFVAEYDEVSSGTFA